jgi:branched-chain amino acid transport system ATP-binding protein
MGIAVALTASPRLLLLDEPLTGMIAEETEAPLALIRSLREQGAMTIVIVEHNVRAMMSLCDRMVVTNFGRRIAEGSPQEIKNNQQVIDAYLGAAITD